MRQTGAVRSATARRRVHVAEDRPVLVPLEPGGRRFTIARGAVVAGLVTGLLAPTPADAGAKDASDPPQEVPVSASDEDDGRSGTERRDAVAPVETVPQRSLETSSEGKVAESGRVDPPATVPPAGKPAVTATTAPTEHPAEVASAVDPAVDPVVEAVEPAGDVLPEPAERSAAAQSGRRAGHSEVSASAAPEAAPATPAGTPAAPGAPAEPAAAEPVPQPPAPERPPQPAAPMPAAASSGPSPTPARPTPERHVHRQAQPTATVAAVGGGTYTVQAGDSLWAITDRLLGAGSSNAAIAGAWPEVYAANRDRIGADPNLILAGMELTIPEGL